MTTKRCAACESLKPISEYPLLYNKKNGKRYPRSYCQACHRTRQKRYQAKRRKEQDDPVYKIIDACDAEARLGKKRLPVEERIKRERRILEHAERIEREDPGGDLSNELDGELV